MNACWKLFAKWCAINCLANFVLMQAALAADPPVQALPLPPPLPHFDPVNPIILNEYAVQKAQAGDISTAIILLERALLIAPYDSRIRRNLDRLRALQAGKSTGLPTSIAPPPEQNTQNAQSATAQPEAVTDDGLSKIPLWPSK